MIKPFIDAMKVDPYTLLKNCKYCSALLQPIAMPRRFGYEGVEWYEITLDKYDGRKDVLWRQGVCNCDSAKRERESGYMSKEERERAGELLYLNSGLPKEFLDKKYDRALAAQNCPNALANLDTVSRYMQEVKSGGKTLLWLHGQGGMGKTHLSIITSNYIMRKYLLETRFVKWVEADKGFNDVRTDNRTLVSALKRAELLCVDDLDKVPISKRSLEVLFEIVDARWIKRLPTILSTQDSPHAMYEWFSSSGKYDEAENKYIKKTGGVIIDRLTDVNWAMVVEWRGTSLRGVVR